MFDHIGLSVRDVSKTRAFYTVALAPLGFGVQFDKMPGVVAFGTPGRPQLWFTQKADGPTGVHIALVAANRAHVDAFHAAALAAGGKDNGAPGLRPHYQPNYYGAFVIDPDGHNLEAVCHTAEG
jgi:catechol 2,3-dioxygenase-like lactoylglutathione lyase family enzyme